jgi:hypothetical protein
MKMDVKIGGFASLLFSCNIFVSFPPYRKPSGWYRHSALHNSGVASTEIHICWRTQPNNNKKTTETKDVNRLCIVTGATPAPFLIG